MKKVIVILLMLFAVSNISNAQFELSGSIGYGVRVNNNLDYDLFTSVLSIEPQYDFGKFKLSAIALSINDSTADFFTGIKPSYTVYSAGNNSISISLSALQGLEGKQLLGGGVIYSYINMFVSADAYHEKKNNQFIGNISVGYYLLR